MIYCYFIVLFHRQKEKHILSYNSHYQGEKWTQIELKLNTLIGLEIERVAATTNARFKMVQNQRTLTS